MNGQTGMVVKYDTSTGRFGIDIEGNKRVKAIKAQNLALVASPSGVKSHGAGGMQALEGMSLEAALLSQEAPASAEGGSD